MNADQIFNVTKEMQALFNEFAMAHQTQLQGDTPPSGHDRDELIRTYAAKAQAIVVKHAKWPADLADRLDKVAAYIKAHPEQVA